MYKILPTETANIFSMADKDVTFGWNEETDGSETTLSPDDYRQFCSEVQAGRQQKAILLIHQFVKSLHQLPTPSNLLLDVSDHPSISGLPPISPLYVALSDECFDVVRYLLTLCPQIVNQLVPTASILTYCYDSETLLHLACRKGFCELVPLFLDLGASTEIQGCRVGTPLHIAAEHGHLEIIDLLLKQGANIEARDSSGNTPLHVAAAWNKLLVVQLLLDRGANINSRAYFGEDVYNIAISRGAGEVLRFLCCCSSSPMFELQLSGVPCPLLQLASFPGRNKSFSVLLVEMITNPQCPADLKVDALLIHATCKIFSARSEAKFKEALKMKEALFATKLSKPVQCHPWYGVRQEIESCEEWDEVQGDKEVEFYYQRCIILERCLGSAHPITYHYIIWLMSHINNTPSFQSLQIRALDLLVSREELKLDLCRAPLFPVSLISKILPSKETIDQSVALMLKGVEVFLKMRDSHKTCTAFKVNPTHQNDLLVNIIIKILEQFRAWVFFGLSENMDISDISMPKDPVLHNLGCKFVSICCSELIGISILNLILKKKFATNAKTATLLLLMTLLQWGESNHINVPDLNGILPLHAAYYVLGNSGVSIILEHGAHFDAVSSNGTVFIPQRCNLSFLSSQASYSSTVLHSANNDNQTPLFSCTRGPTSCSLSPISLLSEGRLSNNSHLHSPLPLFCLCSWFIVMQHIPYSKMNLPTRIKLFIQLHDAEATAFYNP